MSSRSLMELYFVKFNPKAVLKDHRNEPIDDGGKSFTLATALTTALLASYPDEQSLSGEDKVKRFKLAMRVDDGQLTIEEAALARELVAKCFGALIVGRVWEALDVAADGEGAPKK